MSRQSQNKDEPFIRIEGVSKRFASVQALKRVDLTINREELFCLLGSSGCGKTSLLRILSGLDQPSEGRIFIDQHDVTHVPAYLRPVHLMFQSYALFPHLSVAKNVAFGLKRAGWKREAINERVEELLDLFQIATHSEHKPHQLSGGQQQRVALARSLARRPKVLLLDEPLAALDKQLREKTQGELVQIQKRLKTTFIVVTHDQEEAMTIGTRIALMDEGKIIQVGAAQDIYESPCNQFVAQFFGRTNLIPCRVAKLGTRQTTLVHQSAPITFTVADTSFSFHEGQDLMLALRPEKIRIHKTQPKKKQSNTAKAKIIEVAYRGGLSVMRVALADHVHLETTCANYDPGIAFSKGEHVHLSWNARSLVPLSG